MTPRSKEEVQAEYDALYRAKPNKWDNTDRSDFMIETVKDYVPDPKSVVDVGCGNGVTLANYRRHNSTANLYGIDPSAEAIRLSEMRVPSGTFTTEDEFKSIKMFDLVLCMGVAEHAEELLEFLKGLKKRVSPGGICYFEVPHNLLYSKGAETYRRLKIGSKQMEWHFQLRTWEKLLLKAGFEVIERYQGLNATWEFIWLLQ